MNDFSNEANETNNNEQLDSEIINFIFDLLCSPRMPDATELDERVLNNEQFQKLYNVVSDLRDLTTALNKGDLQKLIYSKGFVLSNLKALQANLRHLTWQTEKIATGDFSQKVDFLGDFSESFNKMTDELRENSLKLVKLANLDHLTKIPNRRSLNIFLEENFKASDNICIFTIDIDNFKMVNDAYGHDVGDMVLIHISEILSKHFRNTDLLSRFGGEEFVAVLPNTDLKTAESIARRILDAIEKTPLIANERLNIFVTVSIGISNKRPSDVSFKESLKRSDEALYIAKNNGRNQFYTL